MPISDRTLEEFKKRLECRDTDPFLCFLFPHFLRSFLRKKISAEKELEHHNLTSGAGHCKFVDKVLDSFVITEHLGHDFYAAVAKQITT
jgi:hypothetical protein